MTPLFTVSPATRAEQEWAREMVTLHHYLGKAPDPRTRPLCQVVRVAGQLAGCLYFGRPESTRCFSGELTYGGAEDVEAGRARYDRWEILNLSRLWLCPEVQPGGRWYGPGLLPGFQDRRGVWRSSLASSLIRAALARVGLDYLRAHPPCFADQPYQIRAVLSYCDTNRHRGTVYRAAGFRLARTNDAGVETWWTPEVAPLSPAEDALVHELIKEHPRSVRIRNQGRTLFDHLEARP